MAHPVSSLGHRLGKTSLWPTSIMVVNNQGFVGNSSNLPVGLEQSLMGLLYNNKIYPICTSVRSNVAAGTLTMRLLYYRLITPFSRIQQQSAYLARLMLAENVNNIKIYRRLIFNIWNLKRSSNKHLLGKKN